MITALLSLTTRRAARIRTWIALLVPAALIVAGAGLARRPIEAGPLMIDLADVVLIVVPAGYAIAFAVIVIGQDVASGAVAHLLDTPVSRGRLCLHAILVTTAGTTVISAPALVLLGLLRPDGPGRSGLAPLLALAVVESLVYAALAVGALVLTRRDVLAAVLAVLGWELIGSQAAIGARVASVRWNALALVGEPHMHAADGPLPEQGTALLVLAMLTCAGWAAGTAGLLRTTTPQHK